MNPQRLRIQIIFSVLSFAGTVTAQPDFELRDVVVVFNSDKGTFQEEFYQSLVGEFTPLPMHRSCPKVRVKEFKVVECVLDSKVIELGTIGNKNGVEGSTTGYSIKWKRKVELIENKDAIEAAKPSLKVL